MAGCSAEDELENGSATQQLSMTPMVNDLQTTRVKEEENLHEKTLSSLDFKMFEPTSSERRIDSLFDTPAENKAEELGSGDWKSTLHLDVNNTYPYYAVANAPCNRCIECNRGLVHHSRCSFRSLRHCLYHHALRWCGHPGLLHGLGYLPAHPQQHQV